MGLPPIQRPRWAAVYSQARGMRLAVYVLADAVKDMQGVRFSVSGRDVQAWADHLDAVPTTELVEDLSYRQADIKLEPHPQRLWEGENDPAKHSRLIDEDLRGKSPALVRGVGKAWILHPRMTSRNAVNYGFPTTAKVGKDGPFESWHGARVWQTPGTRHNWDHRDYSQTLCGLMRTACLLETSPGVIEERDIRNILQDPNLSELVSYDGALPARFPLS